MRLLNAIAYEIGWTILNIAAWVVLFLIAAGISKVAERFKGIGPQIAVCARVFALTAWGVIAVSIFVAALVLHARERDNINAVLATGIGIVVWVTWRRSGLPALKRDLFPPKDKP